MRVAYLLGWRLRELPSDTVDPVCWYCDQDAVRALGRWRTALFVCEEHAILKRPVITGVWRHDRIGSYTLARIICAVIGHTANTREGGDCRRCWS